MVQYHKVGYFSLLLATYNFVQFKYLLQFHFLSVPRPIRCDLCVPRRSFAKEKNLQLHKDVSHYQCEICCKFFKTIRERDVHLLHHQVPDSDNTVEDGSTGDVFDDAFYCASCRRNCGCNATAH